MLGGGRDAANDYDFSSKLLYTKTFGEIRVPTEGFIVEVEFYDLKISSPDVSTTQAMPLYITVSLHIQLQACTCKDIVVDALENLI